MYIFSITKLNILLGRKRRQKLNLSCSNGKHYFTRWIIRKPFDITRLISFSLFHTSLKILFQRLSLFVTFGRLFQVENDIKSCPTISEKLLRGLFIVHIISLHRFSNQSFRRGCLFMLPYLQVTLEYSKYVTFYLLGTYKLSCTLPTNSALVENTCQTL